MTRCCASWLDSLRSSCDGSAPMTRSCWSLSAQTPRALFARSGLVVDQVYNAGALSLVIIMICGLFVGMVLGLQGYDLLQRFGSEESLGIGAALGLLKELGPVVTALLFAGRAGTALASEIGLMRATDQLTAMEMMAVDPMRRVVAAAIPRRRDRDAAADRDLHRDRALRRAAGRRAAARRRRGRRSGRRCAQPSISTTYAKASSRACVFGVACSLIAVYEGYNAEPTAEGVGRATTRTVVISAVLTLVLDYILTAFML